LQDASKGNAAVEETDDFKEAQAALDNVPSVAGTEEKDAAQ
jgi:hypothetical protein